MAVKGLNANQAAQHNNKLTKNIKISAKKVQQPH